MHWHTCISGAYFLQIYLIGLLLLWASVMCWHPKHTVTSREHYLDYSMRHLHRTVLLSVGACEHCSRCRRSTSLEAYHHWGDTSSLPHSTHHNFWHPWVGSNWLQMAWIVDSIPPWLKPKSASVLLDKRKWVTHFCIRRVSRLDWEVTHSWQVVDTVLTQLC